MAKRDGNFSVLILLDLSGAEEADHIHFLVPTLMPGHPVVTWERQTIPFQINKSTVACATASGLVVSAQATG